MRIRKNNLKAVSPDRLAKLQGYNSGNFGIDGTMEYLPS